LVKGTHTVCHNPQMIHNISYILILNVI